MDPSVMCSLCNEPLNQSDDTTSIGQLQLQKFIKKSKLRVDGFWMSWEKGESLQVHNACRKRYSAKPDKPPPEKRKRTEPPLPPPPSFSQSEPSSSQSSESKSMESHEFDFEHLCFLCGNQQNPYQKKVSHVRDPLLKDRLLLIAETRDDDLGEEIISRLNGKLSLVQAKAGYHKACYNNFVQPIYARQPVNDTQNDEAFSSLISHLENSSTFKFNLKELRDIMGDNTMSDTILFKKLKQKYGDEIFIDRSPGRQTKIYYKQVDIAKICSEWFCSDGSITEQRRGVILNVAADILRTEIINANSPITSYSPPSQFLQTISEDIPPILQSFLRTLLYKDDPIKEANNQSMRDSIAHAIVKAIRPRSFTSNLQLAIGTYIHRKTGSKLVIDLLSRLGLCASYHDIKLFKLSTIMDPSKLNTDEDTFVQLVFDHYK